MAIADHIVDMGPGAGSAGGTVVFQGPFEELEKSDTLTGKHLSKAQALKAKPRAGKGHLLIENATRTIPGGPLPGSTIGRSVTRSSSATGA